MIQRSLVVVILGLAAVAAAGGAPPHHAEEAPLLVGVFEGPGASRDCVVETFEALTIDPDIRPRFVDARQIALGALEELDVLVFPGGSGSAEYLDLGLSLREKIRAFVIQEGRGVVGICAGAYLVSDTDGYPCLNLIGASAIDREHDERGSAVARVTFTEDGLSLFPEMKDRDAGYIQYHDGPIFVPSNREGRPLYRELAILRSDICQGAGAPAGLTPGKPFFLSQQQGRGRVFASVGHPESTTGMRWTVPRMVRWAAGRKHGTFPGGVVRPDYTGREIMHVDSLEGQAFWKLCEEDPETVLGALRFLADGRYRSGFRWAKGLLRHTSPEVRLRAAEHIVDSEYTAALPDLEASVQIERNAPVRRELSRCRERLEGLRAQGQARPISTRSPSPSR